MESTKFECQLAPVGDPNMKVEWFLNGKPLRHSMFKINLIYTLNINYITTLLLLLLLYFRK